ncbi:MAG: RluA family pseudouridine synthase [Pseudomonadota bacterium]
MCQLMPLLMRETIDVPVGEAIASADSRDAGMRLDAFVAKSVRGLSRSQAKRLIEDGCVLLNGASAKAARAVAAGDRVTVDVPPPSSPSAKPEDIPLDIIYEDGDIIVVAKPAGMVVHPAAGHPGGTLVNALLAHCGDLSGIGGELKPGIVHRLDMGTSGAIIAAKNDEAHRSLAAQFKARTVTKIYLALVFGAMRADSGSFDQPIGRSTGDRKKMSVHTRKGRASLTEWRVAERFGSHLSWIEIELRTGRMHQIRVHFTEAGHPLVGDPLYGGVRKAGRVPAGPLHDAVADFPRPALHAWRLGIDHPKSGKRMEFVAPLPEDIEDLLAALRAAH